MARVIAEYWWVFTLRGMIAMALGSAILIDPSITLYKMILLFGFFALFDASLTIFTFFVKTSGKGGWTILIEGITGLAVSLIMLVWSNLGSLLWPKVAAMR